MMKNPEQSHRFGKGTIVFNKKSYEPCPAKVVKYLSWSGDTHHEGKDYGGDRYVVDIMIGEEVWPASEVVTWVEWRKCKLSQLREFTKHRTKKINDMKKPRRVRWWA